MMTTKKNEGASGSAGTIDLLWVRLLTPENVDRWVEGLGSWKGEAGILSVRLVKAYRLLHGIFLEWAPGDVVVERVQYMERILDVEMSGGDRWRLPASWLEGKLTFMKDLGLLDYCVRCTRIHPREFTCEGKMIGGMEDVSTKAE